MDINELRVKIDEIDSQLVDLFQQRMDVAKDIAQYKKNNSLPVLDIVREREKLASVSDLGKDEMKDYIRVLYSLMFELSRSYQGSILERKTPLYSDIMDGYWLNKAD